ncbi:hypothetical protein BDK51DRAFT_26530, partial [Blyttiomyces helicus]
RRRRLREPFENSKTTCSLSQQRIGNISFKYGLRRCPNAATPSELTAVGQCWRELEMQKYAQAREMESNLGLQSFSVVVERVRESAQEAMQYVAGASAAPNGHRYVVLWWEDAACKGKKCKPAATLSPPPRVSLLPLPRHLRGFLSAGFVLDTGVLYLGYEEISSRSQVILAETISTLFRGIMEDAGVTPQNFAQCPIKLATELPIEKRVGFRSMGFIRLVDYCTEFLIDIDTFAKQKPLRSVGRLRFRIGPRTWSAVLSLIDSIAHVLPPSRQLPPPALPPPLRPSTSPISTSTSKPTSTPLPRRDAIDPVRVGMNTMARCFSWFRSLAPSFELIAARPLSAASQSARRVGIRAFISLPRDRD